MSDTFVQEMETQLLAMRKELLDKLSEDNSDFREMVNAMLSLIPIEIGRAHV